MKEGIEEVVWPSGKCAESPQSLAPRLDTLDGKTICALYNGAYQFDRTWPQIKEALSRKYRGVKFVGWEEFGIFDLGHEMSSLETLPDKLKKHGCDAVVSGRGC